MSRTPETPRYFVGHMRGYTPPWWVFDSTKQQDRVVQSYRHQEQADRFAALMNTGVKREVAMSAVSNGVEVIDVGDLVYLDHLGVSLIPAKVLTVGRVPVPGAPNTAYTQVEATVRLTAARPGYKRGEVLIYTGQECSKVIPRKSVRVKDGFFRIRSGVFNA